MNTRRWILFACFAATAFAFGLGWYAQKDTYDRFAQAPLRTVRIESLSKQSFEASIEAIGEPEREDRIYSETLSPDVLKEFQVGDTVTVHCLNSSRCYPAAYLNQLAPSQIWPVSAVFFLLFTIFFGFWIKADQRKRESLQDLPSILEYTIRSSVRIQLLLGIGMVLAGGIVVGGVWVDQGTETPQLGVLGAVFLGGLFVICMGVGARSFLMGWRNRRIKDSPLYERITYRPSEIVWVFTRMVQGGKYGGRVQHDSTSESIAAYHWIVIGFADGTLEEIQIDTQFLKRVDSHLRRVAPLAHFGFDDRVQSAFREDPRSLLRN